MSLAESRNRLQLPETLKTQLHEFRRRVWTIKIIESVCGALFGLVVAFLAMFFVDRLGESPIGVRIGLFVTAIAGCAMLPLALHRWIWCNRHLEQLARLLSHRYPHVGDQLLGIIELVRNDAEQARSRALCEAAIVQVSEDAGRRNFADAVPNPRHRLWAWLAAVPTAAAVALLAIFPDAASNAWVRLLAPWRETPRYTFAAVEHLPEKIVVAHGEPFAVDVKLQEKSLSHPAQGTAQLGMQQPVEAALSDGRYRFELPQQIAAGQLDVNIGDSQQQVRIEPMLRPELTSVVAEVQLPAYLGLPERQTRDVRGGVISLVKGSQARFSATASRDLAASQVDGEARPPSGATVASPAIDVDESKKVEFRWEDRYGLTGKEPFVLSIAGKDDEAPSVIVEGLPRQKVMIDTEVLSFKIRAHDDFGVKTVGLVWRGIEVPSVKSAARGERILSAGGNDRESLEASGTFSAQALGIEPQPLALRVFVEDYLPGRERVYSPEYVLIVMNASDHAEWLTEMLSRWHRQSLEVRDREMQLYETNKELRALAQDVLDQPETRRRIEGQATAERANGRRLSHLTNSGDELVRQAMRNPEFGVGHLEKWAEMLQILKDISGNRMPSVADLLKQASTAPQVAQNDGKGGKPQPAPSDANSQKQGPMAGKNRSQAGNGQSNKKVTEKKEFPAVPKIVDGETSHQPLPEDKPSDKPPTEAKPKAPTFRLPVTTVVGAPKKKPDDGEPPPPSPAEEKVEEALVAQRDLLAEFEKIADELNRVLAELEGSTLVKRLKAASRLQYGIAGKLGDRLNKTFGLPAAKLEDASSKLLADLSKEEAKGSLKVSDIMDDMQAFFDRRRFVKFKTVLDEMREQDVIGSLRQLGDDILKENGLSIAQAEFWSDTLDRWGDDLVDAGCCGQCPGCKSKGSLPPSIVLEVLQILEGEVNLREDTRVAEQAKPALESGEYRHRAEALSQTQDGLQERVVKVIEKIRELPDAEEDFFKELKMLAMVSDVMKEASAILITPDTGAPAIAAETEAIELLLASKRINPKGGGGGGGPTPGGGEKSGTTNDSALVLVGGGVNEKEFREDRGIQQSTGTPGSVLPEEFRAGIDEYFNRLERGAGGD